MTILVLIGGLFVGVVVGVIGMGILAGQSYEKGYEDGIRQYER